MLERVNACSLHIISIDDVGPFYFGYLGLGEKEEKEVGQVILSFHHA